MKMSRETKLGLIYLKRKILRHVRSAEIGDEVGSIVDVDYVLVKDIEGVFDEMLDESNTPVTPEFDYQMKQDIEDLFASFTPEEVAIMNSSKYGVSDV